MIQVPVVYFVHSHLKEARAVSKAEILDEPTGAQRRLSFWMQTKIRNVSCQPVSLPPSSGTKVPLQQLKWCWNQKHCFARQELEYHDLLSLFEWLVCQQSSVGIMTQPWSPYRCEWVLIVHLLWFKLWSNTDKHSPHSRSFKEMKTHFAVILSRFDPEKWCPDEHWLSIM